MLLAPKVESYTAKERINFATRKAFRYTGCSSIYHMAISKEMIGKLMPFEDGNDPSLESVILARSLTLWIQSVTLPVLSGA